jgi:hypothetical protein
MKRDWELPTYLLDLSLASSPIKDISISSRLMKKSNPESPIRPFHRSFKRMGFEGSIKELNCPSDFSLAFIV